MKIEAIIGIIIIVIFVAFIVIIIEISNKKEENNYQINQDKNQQKEKLPYKLKNSVMTKYEKVMFNILKDYCNKNNYVLLSKVRIADFIDPIYPKYTRDYLISFNKISAKHVDFLICDPADIYPIVAIELDDYTHQRADRQQRDEFVNNVYYSAGLKILHIYSIDEESTINLLNQEIKKV